MSSAHLEAATELDLGMGTTSPRPQANGPSEFLPVFRSGSFSDIGPKRPYMEDEHICIDNLPEHVREFMDLTLPGAFYGGAFYGVFDGHGGSDAASFVKTNILQFIINDTYFPNCVDKAIKSAFVKTDHAFAEACPLYSYSGTTALTTLIFGRTMLVANAGDCRAVLGKRGRAIELSKDHKPDCTSERQRIERLGGSVFDGYLKGELSVSRALGDWYMKDSEGSKGSACPLSAEPELQETTLTEEDEFLIMGCDGLWDVMSSQCAVTIVREQLMIHNDPEKCSRKLVWEAIKQETSDNVTAVVICFSPDPPPRIEIPRSQSAEKRISKKGLNLLQGVLDNNV